MRYLAVHTHLYQPPRENPWFERVERQPSACPFRDWNERVSDECYERLGGAAVRGPDGRVVALVNLFGTDLVQHRADPRRVARGRAP